MGSEKLGRLVPQNIKNLFPLKANSFDLYVVGLIEHGVQTVSIYPNDYLGLRPQPHLHFDSVSSVGRRLRYTELYKPPAMSAEEGKRTLFVTAYRRAKQIEEAVPSVNTLIMTRYRESITPLTEAEMRDLEDWVHTVKPWDTEEIIP